MKICDSVLAEPLIIIFKSCNDWSFSSYLENFPFYTVHKKNDKHSLNDLCPVSLLSICGKLFERIIFSDASLFLENSKVLLNNLVIGLIIPVWISSYQLLIVFTQILIIIHHLKWGIFFLIFQKHMTKFGMKFFDIN